MTFDDALKLIAAIPDDSDGVWLQLRMGKDPGRDRILELRIALRRAWRETKRQESLPIPMVFGAACILHFASEAKQNLSASKMPLRPRLLSYELSDLEMGAFELLSGQNAEGWIIRRPDLGETS